KGRGFTTEEMIATVNRVTRRDYHEFYRRYVSGVEVLPYDTILGYAGYKLESSSRRTPQLGIEIDETPEGLKITRVDRGGPAFKSGLRAGDILMRVDGMDVQKDQQAVMEWLEQRIGNGVKLAIKRAGKDLAIDLEVGSRNEASYKIVELSNPTPDQKRVREAWLRVANK
ncbi:MAG TPA: PDZ domain-containing protein, partial [Blastocatellia bacterium]|nr:PDZ domain-containing protein [Blastocatellia bacterium]